MKVLKYVLLAVGDGLLAGATYVVGQHVVTESVLMAGLVTGLGAFLHEFDLHLPASPTP